MRSSRGYRTVTPKRSRPTLNLVRLSRLAVAACLALGLVYAGLLGISTWQVPERTHTAALYQIPQEYRSMGELRDDSDTPGLAEYEQALDRLEEARSAPLGLFPSYDSARLGEAEEHLGAVVENEETPTWLRLEAAYAQGKIQLFQGDDAAARALLQRVVDEGGQHGYEAQRALGWLDAQAAD